MTRIAVILTAAALTLAGCGVDGAPTRPEPQPGIGVTVSGSAEIGLKSEF